MKISPKQRRILERLAAGDELHATLNDKRPYFWNGGFGEDARSVHGLQHRGLISVFSPDEAKNKFWLIAQITDKGRAVIAA